MKKWIENLLLRWLLNDFEIGHHKMPENEVVEALTDFYYNKGLQQYIGIQVANTIRKNMTAPSIRQHDYYRGFVAALLELQKVAKKKAVPRTEH